MRNKKFSILLASVFFALFVQAQESPPATPWDADPLDVLEPKKQDEVAEPTVPEFKEIPEAGAEPKSSSKGKAVQSPAAQEELAPPTEVVPSVPSSHHAEMAPSAPAATMGNEPDASREAEFNRIYKTYNEKPTSAEIWEKAAGQKKAEIYQVQKGNTLWDISTTFFGDPNFWPKIWSYNNGAIGNPHEINPSMAIHFFAGDINEAPSVELGDGKDHRQGATQTAEVAIATPPIPEPKKKRTPVLGALPGSLAARHVGIDTTKKSSLEIQTVPRKFSKGLEYLGYYLSEAPITGVGVVTGTELDLKSVGEFVYIYVQLDHPDGKDFIVQKNLVQVEDPRQKSRKAQMVEVQGQIEILEQVNAQKNIYRAMVKKSIQPVEVGSLLTPGQLPMIDPVAGVISSGAGARIIGGQFGGNNRSLFSASSLVFLDAGTSQGISEGQSFGVFADESVRSHQTDAVINDRQIGVVKIVKATANFATAYITKANDDILKGDYIGKADHQAMNEPSAASESVAPAKDSGGDSESAPAAPSEGGAEASDLTL